jgi:hypothetical protein
VSGVLSATPISLPPRDRTPITRQIACTTAKIPVAGVFSDAQLVLFQLRVTTRYGVASILTSKRKTYVNLAVLKGTSVLMLAVGCARQRYRVKAAFHQVLYLRHGINLCPKRNHLHRWSFF